MRLTPSLLSGVSSGGCGSLASSSATGTATLAVPSLPACRRHLRRNAKRVAEALTNPSRGGQLAIGQPAGVTTDLIPLTVHANPSDAIPVITGAPDRCRRAGAMAP